MSEIINLEYDECEMWDECDQLCKNTNGSYMCECKANYTLVDRSYCKHDTSKS
jgi:hypothetical protein